MQYDDNPEDLCKARNVEELVVRIYAMNYDELNQILSDASCATRAAECHGFLCGYLCISDDMAEEVFRSCLLGDVDEAVSVSCLDSIKSLATDVCAQIASTDFTLELLLPGDDKSLRERGASFIEWCEGFLSGLGAAGVVRFYTLSEECRELLDDLYKICRLDPDDMNESGEEEEIALTELIEYVRLGAILMHEEFRRSEETVVPQPVFH